jgi:tetratricopeptide (TPR) repeat protein
VSFALHIDRAAQCRALGLTRRAVEEFDKAIALDAGNVNAWKGRGAARLDLGDTEGAIADYNEAVRLFPTEAGAWAGRGAAHLENDDADRSIADFTRALLLEPHNPAIYGQRIEAYCFKGDFERALADCSEMVRLGPGDSLPYSRRAEVHRCKGDYQQAILAYDQAIAIDARASYYLERGLVHMKLADNMAAVTDLGTAIELAPGSPDAFRARSKARAAMGDRELANADYDVALRLGMVQSIDYCWNRGCALERLGERQHGQTECRKAVENCEAGLRIYPNDEALLHRLGMMRQISSKEGGSGSPG